jgi:hypothetical protein
MGGDIYNNDGTCAWNEYCPNTTEEDRVFAGHGDWISCCPEHKLLDNDPEYREFINRMEYPNMEVER